MSLFVRVDIGFFTHRKTVRLFSKIGESAFWVPPRIWAYAASQQIDGNFENYTADEIAMLIGYTNDASGMLEALLEAGFMDCEPLRIHDWLDHNGFHAEFSNRAKNAAVARWRKEKERTKGKESTDTERETETEQALLKHAPSIALSIKPKKFIPPSLEEMKSYAIEIRMIPLEVQACWDHFLSNGWKVGKALAPMKDWQASMRTWKRNGEKYNTQRNGPTMKPIRVGAEGI